MNAIQRYRLTAGLDKRPDHAIAAELFGALLAQHKLSVAAVFVPYSKSRNAKPRGKDSKPWRSLNWRVTLQSDGRDILAGDYAQGEGHSPAYKALAKHGRPMHTIHVRKAIDAELEHGFQVNAHDENSMMFGAPISRGGKRVPLMPDARDVWSSYATDSDVLDSGTFEQWANDLGYDPDSRTAESIWKECIGNALAIRAAIGDSVLAELRELAREM